MLGRCDKDAVYMKKNRTALLMIGIMVELFLLLCLCGKYMLTNAVSTGSGEVIYDARGFGAKVNDAKEYDEKREKMDSECEGKKVALTFDDGPHPYYTEQLLNGLKERGVVVTFFVTGEHAMLHPDVIRRMQEEGHLIGNHTYTHMQLRSDNRDKFKEELRLTNQVIKETTGEDTIYVRPPYGSWDKSFEKELNMIPVLWTVDPLDWCSDDVACVVRNVTEKVGENDIILMHDYYDSTVTAALKIVDELLAEGYVFVTVEEILFE